MTKPAQPHKLKPNREKTRYRRYVRYLLSQKRLLFNAYLCSALGVGLTLAMPWPLKYLIDDALRGEQSFSYLLGFTPLQKVLLLSVAIALIAFLAAVILGLDKVLHARIRENFGLQLRGDLVSHLYGMTRESRLSERSGELTMRLVSDSQQASRLWCKTGPMALKHIATAFFILVLVFGINAYIGLIALLATVILSLLLSHYGPKLKSSADKKRTLEGRVAALTQETVKGIEHLQSMNLERTAHEKYIQEASGSLHAGVSEVQVAVRLERMSQIVSGIALALVAGAGGVMVLHGELTLGTLTVCLSYMALLMKPIEKINEIASSISRALTRLDRIEHLFATNPVYQSNVDGEIIVDLNEISAEKICYHYPSSETSTIQNLDFRFKRGECIAILGPSGSGKSTVTRLILGLMSVTSGDVFANGKNYRDLDLKALRSNFAVLMQDPHLFSGTFRAVLTELNPEVSDERIRQVLFDLRLLDVIDQMPNGVDHLIDESGDRLSGGQRARLLMARALLSDRAVLIFDEPLANIDETSKKILLERLLIAKKDAILVVITHEHSLTRIADQVLHARNWGAPDDTAVTTIQETQRGAAVRH